MPRFIPTMPNSFNSSIGEEMVFDSLRLLGNEYTIFHSLSWIGIKDRTLGEADFVIIHPKKGIMVVEVKSGGIAYKEGQWVQTNTATGYSKSIAPFSQAKRSQFEILERLVSSLRLGRPPLVCHAVWFPSITLKPTDKLPPEAPREIIFDESDLIQVEKAITSVYDYWCKKIGITNVMNPQQMAEVIDKLAPSFHAVPGMNKVIAETEQYYIQLTNQQALLLEYLKEQRTAVIHGLAGTGKTVLAKEKAMSLADGGNVLFLCYNSFLKEYLKRQFSRPGITFHNAHSLAMEILNYPDIGVEELLDELEEYLDICEPDDLPYSHVVIDEGQDLNEGLVHRLNELINAKGGCFYVFYDRNQYVMKNHMPEWVEKAECKLVLHRNCRNTMEIYKTACSMIAMESNISDNSIHGKKPTAIFIKNKADLMSSAGKFVQTAIADGIEPEEIVFLTVETEAKSMLSGEVAIGGFKLASERTDNEILFTTVRKFKGLEAKAVMVVDVSLSGLALAEKQRLTYVGCSRARHILQVAILDDVDPANMDLILRKINPSRNVPKNKKGLGRLLNIQLEN